MRVAFLDLDHTLLAADSNQLWMDFLQSRQWVAAPEMAQHQRFMDDYAQGVLDFEALQAFRIGLDASLPPGQLEQCLAVFQREILLPAVAPLAPGLLSGLRAQGLATVVVSATRASLVEPVARHLAVDHLLTSCFGPQKVHRVEAWLKAQGCSLAGLEESWFYSDSHNDLPLLEAVSHPVAVDPDLRLARLAAQRQWPVLSLRRDTEQPLAA